MFRTVGGETRADMVDSDARRLLWTTLVIVVYATVLYYAYKLNVSPRFAYQGLTFRAPHPILYPCMVGLTAGVACILPSHIERVSDFILWLLFIFGAAPSMLLAQYSRTLSVTEATILGLHLAGCMALVRFMTRRHPRPLPRMRMDGSLFFGLVLALSFLFYTYMIAFVGLHVRTLSFADVYSVRGDISAAKSVVPFLGYLLPLQANVLNPLLIARGVYSNARWLLLVGILGQLLIYSSTGSKAVFFAIFVTIGMAQLFKRRDRPPGLWLLIAATTASVSGLALDRLTGSVLWSSLLIRRVLVVPGALTAAYVSVFMDRPKAHFAEILPIAHNPYEGVRAVNLVGRIFVGNADTAANVNLFGHGYLQAGYPGMYVEAVILVLLLWLADDATRALPVGVAAVVFFAPAKALTSASVFTVLATHGFALAVLFCAMAPAAGWNAKRRQRDAEDSALARE